MRIFLRLLFVFAVCLPISTMAQADSWPEPDSETFSSPNGQFRLTVTPRAIADTLSFYRDKVEEREPAGQAADGPVMASGKLEQRQSDGHWVTLWDKPLVNEVRPVSAIISDDGRHVATFDNWYSNGYGENVIVLYGSDGSVIRSYELSDLVPAYFVDAFPASVSSLDWRNNGSHFDGSLLRVAVREPGQGRSDDSGDTFWIDIDLSSGAPRQVVPSVIARVHDAACNAHRRSVSRFNDSLARAREDLTAPSGHDSQQWATYFGQAAARLLPPTEAGMDFPFEDDPVYLLNPGDYMYRDFRDMFREFLESPMLPGQRLVLGGPSQPALVSEIQRSARRIAAGSLTGRQLYVFADDAHWPAIHDALAPTGAALHQIDIGQPIPQSAEELARLPAARAIDPACTDPATLSAATH